MKCRSSTPLAPTGHSGTRQLQRPRFGIGGRTEASTCFRCLVLDGPVRPMDASMVVWGILHARSRDPDTRRGRCGGSAVVDFDVAVRRDRDGAVVTVSGEIDVYSAPQLRQALVDVISKDARDVTVDLDG